MADFLPVPPGGERQDPREDFRRMAAVIFPVVEASYRESLDAGRGPFAFKDAVERAVYEVLNRGRVPVGGAWLTDEEVRSLIRGGHDVACKGGTRRAECVCGHRSAHEKLRARLADREPE